MIQVRPLTEEDYPKLCEWWKNNRFPIPAKEMLPVMGKGGMMLMKNGVDVCAGFLYLTNSAIAWQEFLVADFHYRESDRKELITLLIKELCKIAFDNGYSLVFTSVKNSNLINRFKEAGFETGSNNTTEMYLVNK